MDGDDIEVVFGHLDDPACYPKEAFEDLPASIKRRPYRWRILPHDEAVRACAYAGLNGSLEYHAYQAPDDGISQFTDCDLWIVISDRLRFPLLPVRPYLLMVYDYLQRYQTPFDDDTNQKFVARAHAAEAVMVTTAFTAGDARQFAGIPAKKIRRVPMLAPEFFANESSRSSRKRYWPVFSLDDQSCTPQESRECIQGASALLRKVRGVAEVSRDGGGYPGVVQARCPAPESLEGHPPFKRGAQASSENRGRIARSKLSGSTGPCALFFGIPGGSTTGRFPSSRLPISAFPLFPAITRRCAKSTSNLLCT